MEIIEIEKTNRKLNFQKQQTQSKTTKLNRQTTANIFIIIIIWGKSEIYISWQIKVSVYMKSISIKCESGDFIYIFIERPVGW